MGKTIFEMSPDGGTTKYNVRDNNIAPVELDATSASQPYEVGEQFVLDSDGLLYTATTTISQGDAIVVYPTAGYNCKLSDSVTEQIADRLTIEDNGLLGSRNLWRDELVDKWASQSSGSYTVSGSQIDISMASADNSGIYLSGNNVLKPSYADITYPLTLSFEYKGDAEFSINIQSEGLQHIRTATTSWQTEEIIINNPSQMGTFGFYNKSNAAHTLNVRNIMFKLPNDNSATYQPYADTNRGLTLNKTDTSVIGNVENGVTASQAYAVGQHFQRNGKYCTVKAAIALNDPLTLGTNYVEGSLGDSFWASYSKTGVVVAAGSYATVDIPAVSGYSCITYSVGASGTGVAANCDVMATKDTSNHINSLRVQNRGTSDYTWALVIDALYVKTDTIVVQTL